MSFIAAGGAEPTAETIVNNGFWPDLDVSVFRDTMRVDSTITEPRAIHALETALMDANSQLADFQAAQQAAGHAKAVDVPVRPGQRAGDTERLYLRAVWNLAKAQLIERYRDYDTTKDGIDRSEALAGVIDDCRRDAAWAIRDIKGSRRTTVELI